MARRNFIARRGGGGLFFYGEEIERSLTSVIDFLRSENADNLRPSISSPPFVTKDGAREGALVVPSNLRNRSPEIRSCSPLSVGGGRGREGRD